MAVSDAHELRCYGLLWTICHKGFRLTACLAHIVFFFYCSQRDHGACVCEAWQLASSPKPSTCIGACASWSVAAAACGPVWDDGSIFVRTHFHHGYLNARKAAAAPLTFVAFAPCLSSFSSADLFPFFVPSRHDPITEETCSSCTSWSWKLGFQVWTSWTWNKRGGRVQAGWLGANPIRFLAVDHFISFLTLGGPWLSDIPNVDERSPAAVRRAVWVWVYETLWNPSKNRRFSISTSGGFLPSTVCSLVC